MSLYMKPKRDTKPRFYSRADLNFLATVKNAGKEVCRENIECGKMPAWAKAFWIAIFLMGGWLLHIVAAGKAAFFTAIIIIAGIILVLAAMLFILPWLQDIDSQRPEEDQ